MRATAFLATALFLTISMSGCLNDLTGALDPVKPKDYIRDSEYSIWHIEVDYVEGSEPEDAALETMRQRLAELVKKDRIVIEIDDAIPGKSTWSASDLQKAQDKHQDKKTGGDTVVTYMIYADGQFEEADVLGVAIGHDLVGIFIDRIRDGCSGNLLCLGNELSVERAVVIHEMGHIIGLVNRGVPMVNDHEASDAPKHSNNRDSVMWKNVDNTGVFGLGSNLSTHFDSNDKLDICSYGGKGSC